MTQKFEGPDISYNELLKQDANPTHMPDGTRVLPAGGVIDGTTFDDPNTKPKTYVPGQLERMIGTHGVARLGLAPEVQPTDHGTASAPTDQR